MIILSIIDFNAQLFLDLVFSAYNLGLQTTDLNEVAIIH